MMKRSYTFSTSLFLISLLALSACSTAPENEGQDNVAVQNQGSQSPTDVVPDDQNPELALAIAAGAVIVDPPAQNVAENSPTNTNSDPNAMPPAPDFTQTPPAPDFNTALNSGASGADPFASTESKGSKKRKGKKSHAQKGSKETANRSIASTGEGTSDGQGYHVKQGDTLMKIAYEQYGNLYLWKEIYAANKDAIQDPNHVPPGTVLKLDDLGGGRRPGSVAIEHNGEQYLIKNGDTLGIISNDVYGTTAKWKELWENNRQLIKDPNKIYAGFFLYYIPSQHASN